MLDLANVIDIVQNLNFLKMGNPSEVITGSSRAVLV